MAEIEANESMHFVLKLHKLVSKVKDKHAEVRQQTKELRTMYDNLEQRMLDVQNQQKEKRNKGVSDVSKKDGGDKSKK